MFVNMKFIRKVIHVDRIVKLSARKSFWNNEYYATTRFIHAKCYRIIIIIIIATEVAA